MIYAIYAIKLYNAKKKGWKVLAVAWTLDAAIGIMPATPCLSHQSQLQAKRHTSLFLWWLSQGVAGITPIAASKVQVTAGIFHPFVFIAYKFQEA